MKEKGYTLLELLVVVLLIGLVLMLYMTSWSKAQSKARDGRRKADLAIVKLSLEAYFNDHNVYPPDNYVIFGAGFVITDENGNVQSYMKQVPQDPLYPTKTYCYKVNVDYMSYFLGADYENEARDPLWSCGVPGTPAPTVILPSTSPQPTIYIAPTLPPASQTPAPTPFATDNPNGSCSPCQRMVSSQVNASAVVGYCCPVSPNKLYAYQNSSCMTPVGPAGLGDFPGAGVVDCNIPYCSDTPVWHQIKIAQSCRDDLMTQGQSVGASCSDAYGCGAIISDCTILDTGGTCWKYGLPWYLNTSCICY